MNKFLRMGLGLVLMLGIAGLSSAQFGGGGFGGFGRGFGGGRGGRGGFGGGRGGTPEIPELPADRNGVPNWTVDPHFKNDVFTFVRLRYTSVNGTFPDGEYKSGGNWLTDFPDSDLNFPFRLHQMTSMKVDPEGKRINITDETLFNYPFVYMLEVGRLEFTDEEVAILRHYLLNGGFLMIDDHWGLNEQRNFREQIMRVFPERPLTELPLEHPIFHCVFDLKAKPQIPGINVWLGSRRTFERFDDTESHYRAIFDDKGRMMLIECANTDLGDGWEREGVNEEYFHLFSEAQAYPMGINIIFYAMTH